MKRLHVNISVSDLDSSIAFYNSLFAAEPAVVKPDYAKWMLDDPRVNFAITTRGERKGQAFGQITTQYVLSQFNIGLHGISVFSWVWPKAYSAASRTGEGDIADKYSPAATGSRSIHSFTASE